MPRRRSKAIFTRAAQVYNSEVGALELGYVYYPDRGTGGGYVKVTNVNEEFRGKKARRGAMMYDYDHSVMVTMNQEELIVLSAVFDDLARGDLETLEFSHKIGNSIKSVLLGVGLDGESPEFQVCITELDRDEPDGEPLEQTWYEVPVVTLGSEDKMRDYRPAVNIIKAWVEEALRVSLMSVTHAAHVELPNLDRGGGSRRRGPRDDYSRDDDGNDGGYDNAEEEDPRRGRTASRRPSRRPAPRRDTREEGEDNDRGGSGRGGDDIPF